MATSEASPAESAPHDFMDAEFVIGGMKTPTDEQAVHVAMSALEGVKILALSGGKLTLEYDPVCTSKAEIGEAIDRAGFHVDAVESGPASPIADALESTDPTDPVKETKDESKA